MALRCCSPAPPCSDALVLTLTQFLAGVGFVIVLLVAFFLELTVR